jgi:hypothetical protein
MICASPANRLEALRGDRAGQYSIRINRQWRICFVRGNGDADAVEIVDYVYSISTHKKGRVSRPSSAFPDNRLRRS